MLINPDSIPTLIDHFHPDDLYQPKHHTILQTILDTWQAGIKIDPIVIAEELSKRGELQKIGGAEYIHTLTTATPTAANSLYHAQRIRDTALIRRIHHVGNAIAQTAQTETDAPTVLQQTQALINTIERADTTTIQTLAATIETTMTDLVDQATGQKSTIIQPTGFYDFDDITDGGLRGGQMIIVAARPGVGKALALDTPLPTPTGWTTMGEVNVGDQLIGADGKPTTITAATDIMHGRPCYEVEFSDGSTIIADAEHQWVTHTRKERRTKDDPNIRTTEEIAATLRTNTKDRRLNHSINNAKPLSLNTQDLLIHPYALGVWLGDGSTHSACFTSPDEEIAQRIRKCGYRVTSTDTDLRWSIRMPKMQRNRVCNWCGEFSQSAYRECCMKCRSGLGTFLGRLRLEGVLGTKHIPQQYLRASEQQRRVLLAGLMDTDGTVSKGGACQIALTNKQLAADTYELIVSLGYRCAVSTKRVKGRTEATSTCYTMIFSTPHRIFTLPRKHEMHKQRRKAKNTTRSCSRFITAVRTIESVPVRCVQVDNDDHMYLAGRAMIPTHNSSFGIDVLRQTVAQTNRAALLFTLEMSATEVTQRILSAESGVPLREFRRGTLTNDDNQALVEAIDRIEQWPIYIDDSPNLTLLEIRAKAKQLAAQNDLGIIMVDYLQLLTSGRRVESRQQEVSEFSRQLKLLAKELNVPVIAVAQLNRDVEQRGDDAIPRLSDLRESGSLEQDADMVILIHRPDSKNKDHERAGEADLVVAKHRGGSIGTITIHHDLARSRFTN